MAHASPATPLHVSEPAEIDKLRTDLKSAHMRNRILVRMLTRAVEAPTNG